MVKSPSNRPARKVQRARREPVAAAAAGGAPAVSPPPAAAMASSSAPAATVSAPAAPAEGAAPAPTASASAAPGEPTRGPVMNDKGPGDVGQIRAVDIEAFARNAARLIEEGGRALAAYLKPREEGQVKSDLPDEVTEVVK